MLDPDDRDAARAPYRDRSDQLGRLRVGQPAADLIERQHRRRGRERARRLQTPAVEPSRRVRPAVRRGEHSTQAQRVDRAIVRLRGRETTAVGRDDYRVLEHRHPGERTQHLMGTDQAAAAARGGIVGDHIGVA